MNKKKDAEREIEKELAREKSEFKEYERKRKGFEEYIKKAFGEDANLKQVSKYNYQDIVVNHMWQSWRNAIDFTLKELNEFLQHMSKIER